MGKIQDTSNLLMRTLGTRSPQALWHRYVLGFLIIFATVSVSHWASVATIKAAEDDAEVLSVSAGQRMLSQRILFLMSETDHDHDPYVEQRLEAALNIFETSHNWLVARPDLSPALQRLYFEDEPIPLDAFSRRFIQLVGIATTAEGAQKLELEKILADWGTSDLLTSLATAADLFRQESEAKIARLQIIQQYTLLAALLVLFLEALLIFIPAQLSVNYAFERLERRDRRLKRSLKNLKSRNHQLNEARQSLAFAANHDPLTGLYNRRAIYKYLERDMQRPHGGDVAVCVIKIDLDLFKEVNDTLGHAAGDALLVRVADVLRRHTEGADIAGRLGGDEFVVLVKNPDSAAQISDLTAKIIAEIKQPLEIDQGFCRIGASIGYTLATSSHATPDQLLIEADLALYEAKRHGRGVARAYSDALATEIETRRVLFQEINEALAQDAFVAYVQPQIHTRTGQLYGCEVLARWRHPDRGIVPPGTFIAAAEEARLIDQIDRHIALKGLDFLEAMHAQGIDLPTVSINASPPTLRDAHLTDRLLQEVRARHLSPDNLIVEVLESTLIEDESDEALKTIEQLSKAGFRVVLDDFGTGYASMSNLSRLKLNGIKLDQSLIKPLPDDRAGSIISALVMLSRNLNMTVVAEGVETASHFASVSRLECDVIQGYAIAKPMPAEDFVQWYASYRSRTAASG
ncbi:MAG: EAL domain-containing protein [Roseobacter sp.]|nr:EAL domain-containing protein [Roseobacter sp.]